MKEHFENARNNVDDEKAYLRRKQVAVEQKRNRLEDLMIDNAIDQQTYKRQHERLNNEIAKIDDLRRTLEARRNVDVNIVEQILAMTRNISQTYLDAPSHLKLHYIRFFFDKIYVRDKKINKVIETPIFKALRKEHQLILRKGWLPVHELTQTLRDLYTMVPTFSANIA